MEKVDFHVYFTTNFSFGWGIVVLKSIFGTCSVSVSYKVLP